MLPINCCTFSQIGLRTLLTIDRPPNDHRDKGHGQQGQAPVEQDQQGGYRHHLDDDADYSQEAHREEHAHRFDVHRGAGHQLPGLVFIVIRKAEALQSVIHGIPQVVGNLLGNNLRKILIAVAGKSIDRTGAHDGDGDEDKLSLRSRMQDEIDSLAQLFGHE